MKPSEFYYDMLRKSGLSQTLLSSPEQSIRHMEHIIAYLPPEERENLKKYFRHSRNTWAPQAFQASIEQINHEILTAVSLIPSGSILHQPQGEIFAGEFPTNLLNACAVRLAGGYLILLNRGTMELAYYLSSALFTRVQFEGDHISSVEKEYEIDWDVVVTYFRNAITQSIHNQPLQPPPPLHSWYKLLQAGMIHRYAMKFVLWHEWSHILLRHLENAREHVVKMAGLSVPILRTKIEDETKADETATQLMISHLFEKPREIHMEDEFERAQLFTAFIGSIFIFYILAMIEKISGTQPSDHPPAGLRLERVKTMLDSSFPHYVSDVADSIDSLLSMLAAIKEDL